MSDESKPCVIWECIYDHGNGKHMGEASAKQRERAFAALEQLRQRAGQLDAELCNREVLDKMLTQCIAERDQLHAEVEALRAEVQRLRAAEKDAARYRWLKDQGHFRAMSMDMGGNHSWIGMGRAIGKGPTVDEAIDAAIKTQT